MTLNLTETPNRLAVVAVLFSVAFFLSWTAAPPAPAGTFPILHVTTAAAIAVSLLVFYLTRRWDRRPSLLVDVALVYEVFACLVIALSEHWLPWPDTPVRGISWLGLVLVVFPLAVTAPPGRTLLAALVGASMGPSALLLMTLKGNPLPGSRNLAALVLPTYLAAGVAYFLSRVLHRLGQGVEQAGRLGNYDLVKELGKGGMGEVWLANHRLLERQAAVKIVRPEIVSRQLGEDPETVFRRFEREARTTAALSSPHTISLFDYGISEGGAFYYVMELLEGLDLETLVGRFGPLPAERVIHLLVQVCSSLAEAHDHGLIHRDVKPANVYACRLGVDHDVVKVLDFGLVITAPGAEHQLTRLTNEGLTSGTPAYMAPEMATGAAEVDGRADLYAVGCLAYFLLTGRTVFESSSLVRVLADHVQTQPTPPSQRTELPVPEDLETVVLDCLEKNPDRRPEGARELAGRLLACELAGVWTPARAEAWWKLNLPRSDREAPR